LNSVRTFSKSGILEKFRCVQPVSKRAFFEAGRGKSGCALVRPAFSVEFQAA
jgi:hypothetical protein